MTPSVFACLPIHIFPLSSSSQSSRVFHLLALSPLLFQFHLSFHLFQTDIDAPTNLVTTEVTEDTATVSWEKVQAEVEGYMLSYSSAEGSNAVIPLGPDSASYRLIGLRPGVLHTVYIWAVKGEKTSRKTSTEAETGKL